MQEACPKCSCTVSRTEDDAIGSMRICARCGHCTYLDRHGEIIREQEDRGKLNNTTDSIMRTGAEPATAEPATAEQAKAEQAKVEQAKAEQAEAEQVTAGPTTAEPAMAEPAMAEPAAAEPAAAEQAGGMEAGGMEAGGMEAGATETDGISVPGGLAIGATQGECTLEVDQETETEADPEPETAGETDVDKGQDPDMGPDPQAEGQPTGEQQPDGVCPDCGEMADAADVKRFRRMTIIQCPNCRNWRINPEADGGLDSRSAVIGAAIQANLQGTTGTRLAQQMERLTGEVKAGQQNLNWWTRRHVMPAVEEYGKLQLPTASRTWEIDVIAIRPGHSIWSITDQMTQYILATGGSEQDAAPGHLLNQAELISGEQPTVIILGHTVARNLRGLERYADQGTDIIWYGSAEENPDNSMVRFRTAARQRIEASLGKMSIESANAVMAQLAFSINLFEECPETGTTPAENAGVTNPHRDWGSLIQAQSKKPPPEEMKTSSNRSGRQLNQAPQGSAADGEDDSANAPEPTPETAPETETTPAPETEEDGGPTAAPEARAEDGAEGEARTPEREDASGPAAGPATGPEAEPDKAPDGDAAADADNAPADPEQQEAPSYNGEITLKGLLEQLNQQEEEAFRKYMEIVQAREKVEGVIQFLQQEELTTAA